RRDWWRRGALDKRPRAAAPGCLGGWADVPDDADEQGAEHEPGDDALERDALEEVPHAVLLSDPRSRTRRRASASPAPPAPGFRPTREGAPQPTRSTSGALRRQGHRARGANHSQGL